MNLLAKLRCSLTGGCNLGAHYASLTTEQLHARKKTLQKHSLITNGAWLLSLLIIIMGKGLDARILFLYVAAVGGSFAVTYQDARRRKKIINDILDQRGENG